MTNTPPSVEQSLAALSEALGRADDDFRGVRSTIDRARSDIATHNTAISRHVISAAVRAIEHLEQVDEALRDVLKGLAERD